MTEQSTTVKLIEITKDCYCEHDIHEMTHYPRSEYKMKPQLKTGTELEVIEEWSNFYGRYYRVKTNDGIYDISYSNAKVKSIRFKNL